MQNQAYPSDKIVSYKELITAKLNEWRETLIQRTGFYHEAKARYIADPRMVIQTQNGRMPIFDIMESRINAVIEARAWVSTLEKMLDSAGVSDTELAAMWSDEQVRSPSVVSDAAALGVKGR